MLVAETCPSLGNVSDVTLAWTCTYPGMTFLMLALEVSVKIMHSDPCNRPRAPPALNDSYDFIVIGGGSGGATVASKLSEEFPSGQYSVLLIEAGLDESTSSQLPSMYRNFLGTEIDWNYLTEPEENACLNNEERRCHSHRGKVLGGTSALSDMTYLRGSKQDYGDWAKAGNPGWSYDEVLPLFKKTEDNKQIEELDKNFHGVGGALKISKYPSVPELGNSIVEAGEELGYKATDLNGANHTGFMIAQGALDDGLKLSAAKALLWGKHDRTNLHILVNATATRILFDENKKAVGVELLFRDKLMNIKVNNEVIVSGGAIGSPQILLNSGVGPKDDLESLKIPVVHDLPGVGKNLQNHMSFPINFTVNEISTNVLKENFPGLEFIEKHGGPLTGIGLSSVIGMINTKLADPSGENPDIQMRFQGYDANCLQTEELGSNKTIQIIPTLLRPKSRGHVKLSAKDSPSKPLIHSNYLSEADDVNRLVEGIKFAISLSQAEALKKHGIELVKSPVKNCENLEFASDAYWECALKHETGVSSHEVGTCKMGPADDPLAVVDSELKVHGVQGVRVVDGSVIPSILSGNIDSTAIMIAERVAELIKSAKIEN